MAETAPERTLGEGQGAARGAGARLEPDRARGAAVFSANRTVAKLQYQVSIGIPEPRCGQFQTPI